MAPTTQYARSGDVNIAYQVSGSGPLDVVVVHGFVSNVDLMWDMPFSGAALRSAETFARVITFDKRGTGLSDRNIGVPTLEERMDDVRAVMDAAGSERAALWGVSEGGPMSILFAATYPERTAALVLEGSFARLRQAPDQPFGYSKEEAAAIIGFFGEHWGTGQVLSFFFPSVAGDPATVELFARYERNSASPQAMVDILEMLSSIDVRPILPTISVPTLVVHSQDDGVVAVECGRYLAEHIPGARYHEVSAVDHLPVDKRDDVFVEIEEFLTGHRPSLESDRVLKTVLFTDIVDSTKHASELGDERWRTLLDRHDLMMRSQLHRYRGTEVKATGDGFFAAFDGPARAVQCALAANDEVRGLGLSIRAGVHTGECVQRGEDLGGIGVHIGARVAALAEPGQVLVSRTVTDLVAGSGLQFLDRGLHSLKGVPGTWQLFAVDAPEAQPTG